MAGYDLEDRSLNFSKEIIKLCNKLPKNQINNPMIDQIMRSGTSIGANYREANDALGKKDFVFRLRIARKEAKETIYWLELLNDNNMDESKEIGGLIQEATELRNILSAIIAKSK